MKQVLTYLKNNKHFFLLLYAFIYIRWFCYLEKTVTTKYHIIHITFDEYIPFCEYFIIPYLLWFVYMAVVIIYIAFTDGPTCWRMGVFLITGMTVFLFISTVYPNGHMLRPRTFERDNIFVHAVQMLYRSDTPTNLFPSIHVYNSLGCHIAVTHCERLKEKKWIKLTSFILMVSIILSTMFLKQHSIFDVLTALALGTFMYSVCYGNIAERLERHRARRGLHQQLDHI
jgi:membrane-associated phospholipid phosphatase